MPATIEDGGLVCMDALDKLVYEMDWSHNLAAGVGVLTSAWSVAVVRGSPGLTADASRRDGQSTFVRLSGGALGSLYQVTNHIVTNEYPAQEKDRGFLVLIEDL